MKEKLSGGGDRVSPQDNDKEKGFTIVEVMIVLAIAGLVLAIVFIAVPALQRNSRDSQRRGDISALRGGINTWSGNNNGDVPSTATEIIEALDGISLNFYDASPAAVAVTDDKPIERTIAVEAKLAPRSGPITNPAGAITAAEMSVWIDGAVLVPEAACTAVDVPKGAALAAGDVGYDGLLQYGSVRSYAIVYGLESDANLVCVDNS